MKKRLSIFTAITLILTLLVTALPVYAVGSTSYETGGDATLYHQQWFISEKVATGNANEYKVKIYLKTNYNVAPVGFEIDGADSLVSVTVGDGYYSNSYVSFGKTGLVIITPDTQYTITSKTMNGCIAEVVYTSATAAQATVYLDPKTKDNAAGTLMAARCTAETVNGSDFIVGQSATVYLPGYFPSTDYSGFQGHVVGDRHSKNEKHRKNYFNKFATALDGSDGTPDMCVPGLDKEFAMVPQGLGYCEKWNCVFISSYYKLTEDDSVKTTSTLYSLDFSTGQITGAYQLYYDDGSTKKAMTGHVGGVACYGDYVYVADGAYIYRFALSDFDEFSKNAVSTVRYDVGSVMNNAKCAYVTITDGILWTGNFYDEKDYPTKALSPYNSIILGYELSGGAITEDSPDYKIKVPNSVNHIQCASYKDGTLYISQSYGRTKDSRLVYVDMELGNSKTFLPNEVLSINALPMMEGFFIKDGNLYAVFESASNFYMNNADGKGKSKNPTDVIWRININNLINNGNCYFNLNNSGKIDNKKLFASSPCCSDIATVMTVSDTYTVETQPSFNNQYYGTGSVIKVLDENENILEEYELIIQGDNNGDSIIDVLDCMLAMLGATNGNGEVLTAYDLATDLAEDGQIDMNDYSAIVNLALQQVAEEV